jgi:hypothetical protein
VKTNLNHSMSWAALSVIYSSAVDALLCGACGGLYGLVYAGIGAGLHGEMWRLVASAGYFALCGTIIGAMLGARNGIVNVYENNAELPGFSFESSKEKQIVPAPHLSKGSLVAAPN